MSDRQVSCPVEGCDYVGPPASVAGHVSGTPDAAHDWNRLGYDGACDYKDRMQSVLANDEEPTRILHVTDTHLHRKNLNDPARRDDYTESFKRVCETALEHDVDAVLHTGDIFWPRNVPDEVVDLVAYGLRALAENGIDVVLVPGDRDPYHADLLIRLVGDDLLTVLDGDSIRIGSVELLGVGANGSLGELPRTRSRSAHTVVGLHRTVEPPIGEADCTVEEILDRVPAELVAFGGTLRPATASEPIPILSPGPPEPILGVDAINDAIPRDTRVNIYEFADGTFSWRRQHIETRPFAGVELSLTPHATLDDIVSRLDAEAIDDAALVVRLAGHRTADSIESERIQEILGRQAHSIIVYDDRESVDGAGRKRSARRLGQHVPVEVLRYGGTANVVATDAVGAVEKTVSTTDEGVAPDAVARTVSPSTTDEIEAFIQSYGKLTHVFRSIEPPSSLPTVEPLSVLGLDYFESPSKVDNPSKYTHYIRAFAKDEGGAFLDSEELQEFFLHRFGDLFYRRFLRDRRPYDCVVIYPGHEAGSYSEPLDKLAATVVEGTPMDYRPLLTRTETVEPQKGKSEGDRWDVARNPGETLAVTEDVSGQSVILLDDITTSGASLLAGARSLREAGASHVVGATLGVTLSTTARTVTTFSSTASEIETTYP